MHVYQAATGDRKLRNVKASNTTLYVYGQKGTPSAGKVQILVERQQRKLSIMCELLEGEQYHSILGYEACVALDIIEIKDNDRRNPIPKIGEQSVHATQAVHDFATKEQIIKKYPEVFKESVGKLSHEYKIRIDTTVIPVQHAPRRVPAALRSRLLDELQQLEEQGIIAKVTQPTDWVSSLLVVPKKDHKICICIDPRDLNKAIKREHYQIPTIEDISTHLEGARVFTVLDVKQGFWHVPLENQSSYLTTFNSPFGRYRWLRMPFGISSAPEIFQRCMHQLVEGLHGIEVVADDFMICGFGTTQEEAVLDHDRNLSLFLDRCKEENVVLGAKKFEFRQSEVPFIGHMATANGLKPGPQKVEALLRMPAPTDVAGVRRFLGMVQYLAKFMPKLSEMTKPLRELTQKEVVFAWQGAQEKAFQMVKAAASNAPVLRYYSLDEEVTVQSDSSQFGLGAALLQNGQPVAFASRSLTSAEQHYAQIEKECLSIVFACEQFH